MVDSVKRLERDWFQATNSRIKLVGILYDPINATADLLTKSGLPIETTTSSAFRLTFYFPWISALQFGDGNASVPFVLPALRIRLNSRTI